MEYRIKPPNTKEQRSIPRSCFLICMCKATRNVMSTRVQTIYLPSPLPFARGCSCNYKSTHKRAFDYIGDASYSAAIGTTRVLPLIPVYLDRLVLGTARTDQDESEKKNIKRFIDHKLL